MSPRRVRLFVALNLPGDVREALAKWAALALGAVPGARPSPAVSLHVTLCFLGATGADQVPAIASACRVAADHSSVELTIGEPLWLPPHRPHVVAMSLVDVTGALGQLQPAVAGALVGGGWYQPERRPFMAHATVARIGRGGPGSQEDGSGPGSPGDGCGPGSSGDGSGPGSSGDGSGPRRARDLPEVEPPSVAPFTARAVSLYRSRTGPAGARYESLATVTLPNSA